MPLLGVISGPLPTYNSEAPDLTKHLQDIGILSIRNNDYYDDRLDMEGIFRCPDTSVYPSWDCDANNDEYYHWGPSDTLFDSMVKGGFEVFFRLGGEYECGIRKHDFKGPQNLKQENNWIIAAKKVVERYDNWNNRNNVLKYLDIWTEFPGEHFWTRDNLDFIKFWQRAYDSLKTAFPDKKIGGPGFVPKSTLDIMQGVDSALPVAFLSALYEKQTKLDWLGWHFWSNDPEDFIKANKGFEDLLHGEGSFSNVPWKNTGFFDNVELICDAYGSSTTYMDSVTGEFVEYPKKIKNEIYNKSRGAAILTGIWIALQYTSVTQAYYYRCGDPKSDPNADPNSSDSQIGMQGLFFGDKNGTYKPAAYSVKLWSKLYNEYNKLLTVPLPSLSISDTTKKLWVIAGQNQNGDIGIIVANLYDFSQSFEFKLFGNDFQPKDYDLMLYEVSDKNTGIVSTKLSNMDTFIIDKYSVQFFEIKKKVTGLNEKKKDFLGKIKIYPNPVKNGEFYLQCNNIAKDDQIALWNSIGERIYNFKIFRENKRLKIKVSELPSGIYFVKFRNKIFQLTILKSRK